jgi:hypothetical protein
MRINFYGRVTPQIFKIRGKDQYKTVNGLKNYVSQSNRSGEMAVVLKKHEDSTTNEIFASLRTTNFNDYIEETDDVIGEDIVIKDDESDIENDSNDQLKKQITAKPNVSFAK